VGQDLGGRPVPHAIQEFEAPSAPEAPRPRRPLLLVGLGLALAVGLAVGLFVARRGGEPQGVPVPVAAPAPSPAPAETPAEAARAVPLEAVATPRPTHVPPTQAKPANPADEPKPADVAERAAPRKGVRARRQEAAPATPAAAEGVVPRGGLLDDDGPRAPGAGEGKQPAVLKVAAPVAPTALEPVAATAREPAPDGPRYLASGFRSPRLAQADCLSENLRLPPQLAEMVAGPVTVKFAVYPDGRVDQLQVMNKLPDPRIGEAVARAVRACEWVPGADADGTPTPLWVVQPLRLAP
jgi:outer membrane biosynthesis protein TonB